MPDRRILVVGTTSDYIAYIVKHYPDRVLFLTDREERMDATEPAPDKTSEIVLDLSDSADVAATIQQHLRLNDQTLTGITCFDCEWLTLAAEIAELFKLPFPSIESVRLSRNKHLTKMRWAEKGVRCPKIELINSVNQALTLVDRFKSAVILKPLTGSGSELTYRCSDTYELGVAYRAVTDGLVRRSETPLYRADQSESFKSSSRPMALVMTFPPGYVGTSSSVIYPAFTSPATMEWSSLICIILSPSIK